jgi:predicted acyl esterase
MGPVCVLLFFYLPVTYLQEDVLLMGHPRLVLWVRCLSEGAVSADFIGRLCIVQPNGRSINICDGVHRVKDFSKLPRSSDGQAFKVEVDIYPVRRHPSHLHEPTKHWTLGSI